MQSSLLKPLKGTSVVKVYTSFVHSHTRCEGGSADRLGYVSLLASQTLSQATRCLPPPPLTQHPPPFSRVISFPTTQHILPAPLAHTCAGGLQDFVMEEESSLEVSQSTTSCGVDGSLILVCNYWVEVIPGLSISLLRLAE